MMMKKNVNLELCLFPPSSNSHLHPTSFEEGNKVVEDSPVQDHDQQQHRPLTIVYDGKICVRDATEFQARSILMLANKEMEERIWTPSGSSSSTPSPSSPTEVFNNLYSPPGTVTSPSMKKSLQRFLHKRKNRIQQASPYHLNLN